MLYTQWKYECFSYAALGGRERGGGGCRCSLGFPLLVGDLVRGNTASVAGPDAADVCEGEEARDAHQTHAGAVQVHLSQIDVF